MLRFSNTRIRNSLESKPFVNKHGKRKYQFIAKGDKQYRST